MSKNIKKAPNCQTEYDRLLEKIQKLVKQSLNAGSPLEDSFIFSYAELSIAKYFAKEFGIGQDDALYLVRENFNMFVEAAKESF